ncbi:MAG: DUF4258 domain-containing protein [Solirubrobacterales bacterium]
MIRSIAWSDHARERAPARGLSRVDVEAVIREGHGGRRPNPGAGDWRVEGIRADGESFVVIYDYPTEEQRNEARIVTVWRRRAPRRR